MIVINACSSEDIGLTLMKLFPQAAIFAIKKREFIKDKSAKEFTRLLYSYVFELAGLIDKGTIR